MECRRCYGKGYFFPDKNTDEVVMCDCLTIREEQNEVQG